MREKQLRLIVTFNTTTGAMAMEKACKSENIPGRLIQFLDKFLPDVVYHGFVIKKIEKK